VRSEAKGVEEMIREGRNWVEYRNLPNMVEVDFHHDGRRPPELSYGDCMGDVYERTLSALVQAQKEGKSFVMFRHGASTSGPGRTTSRSMVRNFMRSKEATPYILRAKSIQHPTVFIAAVRPLPEAGPASARLAR